MISLKTNIFQYTIVLEFRSKEHFDDYIKVLLAWGVTNWWEDDYDLEITIEHAQYESLPTIRGTHVKEIRILPLGWTV